MAHWTIYITNVPTDLLATREVFVIGRYWQSDVFMKNDNYKDSYYRYRQVQVDMVHRRRDH